MKLFRPSWWLLALALLLVVGEQASAQIQVDISLRRALYIVYEPIVCTVIVTNRTGGALELSDVGRERWFGFAVETTDGRPLPPVDANYQNEPTTIPAGGRIVRNINITPLFPLNEFGTYRIKAVIHAPDGKYYESPQLNVQITEGRLLWQQTVGVPEGAGQGKARTISVLAHRLPNTSMLYLRVEDKDAGVIYCTAQLGRFVAFGNPDVQLDGTNQIHIIQNIAPKQFLYSQFDLNGKVIGQQGYQMTDTKPHLVRGPDGSVRVTGGVTFDPRAAPAERSLPKLSDRPIPLPTPQVKPTPEDPRPKNLLSR